jgi:hypothetical protein
MFSEKELRLKEKEFNLLCETFKDDYTWGNNPNELREDFILNVQFNYLVERWNVNQERLINKFKQMSDEQIVEIHNSILSFWDNPHAEDELICAYINSKAHLFDDIKIVS